MKDLLRAISVMTYMAGISTTPKEENYDTASETTTCDMQQVGKQLGHLFFSTDFDDEERLLHFNNEIKRITKTYKSPDEIRAISNAFLNEVVTLENIESNAMLFSKLRMAAMLAEDFPTVRDIEAIFYQVVEKCRADKGEEEAERFQKSTTTPMPARRSDTTLLRQNTETTCLLPTPSKKSNPLL